MRVLITGARGQLGRCLRDHIPDDWEVIFTDSKTLDITNMSSVDTMMAGFLPDVVINTAAYTNVTQAEHEIELAFQVNANGVRNLAIASERHKSRLIHISTDFVFDGAADKPYTIFDAPNPINAYGKSKLAGEFFALTFCSQAHIVRTSSVYSEYGINFVQKILASSQTYQQLDVTTNLTKPTYAGDLANFIIDLIHQNCSEKILHFTGLETISWADFARAIVNQSAGTTQIVDKIAQEDFRPKQTLLQNTSRPDNFKMDFNASLNHVIQHLHK